MLHLLEIGDGHRPLVFIHGLFGRGKNFQTTAKGLLARDLDLRMALLDLPNHGQSPWTESIDYADMAELVAASIRKWSPDQPVALVGHSMGGRTAMQLALRHPDLVERLVVSDISPVAGDRSSRVFEAFVASLQRLNLDALESRTQADEHLAPLIPNETIRGFLLQNLRRSMHPEEPQGWYWQCNLDLIDRRLGDVAAWPPVQGQFTGPVLWVRGALSGYVQDAHRPAMDAYFPHNELVTIPDAGHWVHSEQPAAFVQVLGDFLSRD